MKRLLTIGIFIFSVIGVFGQQKKESDTFKFYFEYFGKKGEDIDNLNFDKDKIYRFQYFTIELADEDRFFMPIDAEE